MNMMSYPFMVLCRLEAEDAAEQARPKKEGRVAARAAAEDLPEEEVEAARAAEDLEVAEAEVPLERQRLRKERRSAASAAAEEEPEAEAAAERKRRKKQAKAACESAQGLWPHGFRPHGPWPQYSAII